MRIIQPDEGEVLDIELEEDFLKKNKQLSEKNRAFFDQHGVRAIDVMGSIGSGKTSLLQLLILKLSENLRIGVIAGDLTTEVDAKRLEKKGVEVLQVNTGKECHLDANLIKKALEDLPLDKLDVVFIENVGNLICPAEFPLGAHQRLVVISVTEGPWMVKKHPYIFEDADVVAINKTDLAEAMQVEPGKLARDITKINPKTKSVPISCRQSKGIAQIIQALGF